MDETPLETYARLTRVLLSISQHHNDGVHKEVRRAPNLHNSYATQHILVVTHALGVDAAARWMTRQPLTTTAAANRSADNVGLYFPYLANVSGARLRARWGTVGVLGASTNASGRYARAPLLVDGLLPVWRATGAHNHADTHYIGRAREQMQLDA